MSKKIMCVSSIVLFLGMALSACGGGNDDGGSKPPTPPTPDKPDVPEVVLTVTPTSVAIPADGGTYEIQVSTTDTQWTAKTNDDWIDIKLSGENGNSGTVTVKANENKGAARMAVITVSSGNKSVSVGVDQEMGLYLNQSETLGGSGANQVQLTVNSPTEWTAQSDKSWVKVSKQESQLVLDFETNTSMENRQAVVTIANDKQTVSLPVVQESAGDPGTDIKSPLEGYELVWHDEFNEGSQLDENEWEWEEWKAGNVNNELQAYTKSAVEGINPTELKDGKLYVNCFQTSTGTVYSGRVNAKNGGKGWQYGYFEARMLLPKGKGTWPAYWMMPLNVDWNTEPWPRCGEIDIMEEVGCVPNEVSSSLHAEGHNHTNGTQVTHAMTIKDAEWAYHVYALEWTEDYIRTYVDGKEQLYYKNPGDGVVNWPYDKPYHLIFNLAWGGSWGGMYGVDNSVLPVTMKVDYIRVFQKK